MENSSLGKTRNILDPRVKKRLSQIYEINKFPTKRDLESYSREFNIEFKKLRRWFQNRRAIEKRIDDSHKKIDFDQTDNNQNISKSQSEIRYYTESERFPHTHSTHYNPMDSHLITHANHSTASWCTFRSDTPLSSGNDRMVTEVPAPEVQHSKSPLAISSLLNDDKYDPIADYKARSTRSSTNNLILLSELGTKLKEKEI